MTNSSHVVVVQECALFADRFNNCPYTLRNLNGIADLLGSNESTYCYGMNYSQQQLHV